MQEAAEWGIRMLWQGAEADAHAPFPLDDALPPSCALCSRLQARGRTTTPSSLPMHRKPGFWRRRGGGGWRSESLKVCGC